MNVILLYESSISIRWMEYQVWILNVDVGLIQR